MNDRSFLILKYLIFIFVFAVPVFGQAWLTRNYTELDGLPNSSVYDITQDHQGRMWMANQSGISCYNGFRWDNYTTSVTLPYSYFLKISVSHDGRIYSLVADSEGKVGVIIFREKDKQWIPIKSPPFFLVKRRDDVHGFLLVKQGFDKREVDTRSGIFIATNNKGIIYHYRGKWGRLGTGEGLPDERVFGLVYFKDKIYAATAKGLAVINKDLSVDTGINEHLNLKPGFVRGICIEKSANRPDQSRTKDRFWIYFNNRLGYFFENDHHVTFPGTESPFNSSDFHDSSIRMLSDNRRGVYLGYPAKALYYDYKARNYIAVGISRGLINEGAFSFYIDYERNIWTCGIRGVSKIAGRRFNNYYMIHGMTEDEVTAVLEYEPGKFVLGHTNGLTFMNGNQFTQFPFPIRPNSIYSKNWVVELKMDSRKHIWVACSATGVVEIDKNKEMKWYTKALGLPSRASTIHVDKNDNVWVGTWSGLFIRKRGANKFVNFPVGKETNLPIRRIYGGPDQRIYVACRTTGLHIYDLFTKEWKHYKISDESLPNDIASIYKDKSGRIWIGTMAGLYYLHNDKPEKFKKDTFEINRPVFFVMEDRKDRFWFGSDNGVIRWAPTTGTTIHYSIPEGLSGLETNRAAGIIDSTGRPWIGTNRGLSIYNEEYDDFNFDPPKPKINLIKTETDDVEIPWNIPIELGKENHSLVFHFRVVSLVNENKIGLSYKLEGYDKHWIVKHSPAEQVVRYGKLEPGTYRFHLKARNALGVWSDVVTSAPISILGPIYKQWWFILSVVLVALVIMYTISHFIATERNAALLEKLVKERTRQLEVSERQYRSLFEESRDTIISISREGKLLDINPAGLELFGHESKEDALRDNQPYLIYKNPADRDSLIRKIILKGYVEDYELELKRKNGDKITVLLSAHSVKDEAGKIEAVRGFLRDITEKKKLQQQLIHSQKMEAIGTLAGGIAHDFNNLLGVIIGYIDLIRDEVEQKSNAGGKIKRIETAAKRAADLVSQILTFSRRKSSGKRKPVRMAVVIQEAMRLLRSSLPSTIDINCDIQDKSGIVMADPTQIHQVIMNLCTNAAHAMKETGGRLTVVLNSVVLDNESVSAYDDVAPGRYLKLMVADTGHGIEKIHLKRIFDPFFTTKKPGEGTGLGLSVIHGIVKSYNGGITVYSERGKGTTFNVLLPYSNLTSEPVSEKEGIIPKGNGETILFVDDEIALMDMSVHMLSGLGYNVVAKSNSADALKTFKNKPNRFDLVITDLTMPNMTGPQLAKELSAIRPGVPIILCTGFSDGLSAKDLEKSGIHTLLLKPISQKIMADAIKKCLTPSS